jgi:hypothetical protein
MTMTCKGGEVVVVVVVRIVQYKKIRERGYKNILEGFNNVN